MYPTNAFESHVRDDKVPLGSSPTKSKKKTPCNTQEACVEKHYVFMKEFSEKKRDTRLTGTGSNAENNMKP